MGSRDTIRPCDREEWLGASNTQHSILLLFTFFFIVLIIIFSLGLLSALRCNELRVLVVVQLITAVARCFYTTQTAVSRVESFSLLTFRETIGVVYLIRIF